MCGIGPKHIRILCDNSWEGGCGISPTVVGDLTLDQIFMMLTDKKLLRGSKRNRSKTVSGDIISSLVDKDGFVKGRASDGSPLKGAIHGKSLARRLIEAEEEKNQTKTEKRTRRAARREKRRKERAERSENGS